MNNFEKMLIFETVNHLIMQMFNIKKDNILYILEQIEMDSVGLGFNNI